MSNEETPQDPEGGIRLDTSTPEQTAGSESGEADLVEQSNLAPPQKSGNPIERKVFWTLICAMIAFGLLEARAYFGYTNSMEALQAAEEKNFSAPMGKKGIDSQLFRNNLDEHFSFFPRVSEEKNEKWVFLTYRWFSLVNLCTNKNYDITIELESDQDDALVRRIIFPNTGIEQQKPFDPDREYIPYDGRPPMAASAGGRSRKRSTGNKKKKSNRGNSSENKKKKTKGS